jgi:hypothetical protein
VASNTQLTRSVVSNEYEVISDRFEVSWSSYADRKTIGRLCGFGNLAWARIPPLTIYSKDKKHFKWTPSQTSRGEESGQIPLDTHGHRRGKKCNSRLAFRRSPTGPLAIRPSYLRSFNTQVGSWLSAHHATRQRLRPGFGSCVAQTSFAARRSSRAAATREYWRPHNSKRRLQRTPEGPPATRPGD